MVSVETEFWCAFKIIAPSLKGMDATKELLFHDMVIALSKSLLATFIGHWSTILQKDSAQAIPTYITHYAIWLVIDK